MFTRSFGQSKKFNIHYLNPHNKNSLTIPNPNESPPKLQGAQISSGSPKNLGVNQILGHQKTTSQPLVFSYEELQLQSRSLNRRPSQQQLQQQQLLQKQNKRKQKKKFN